MNNNFEEHKNICNELFEIYKYKNIRYGDSFTETLDKYGNISALTRISDKFKRIEHNILTDIDDNEKLEDNLMDMANYCIMTLIYLREIGKDMVKHDR